MAYTTKYNFKNGDKVIVKLGRYLTFDGVVMGRDNEGEEDGLFWCVEIPAKHDEIGAKLYLSSSNNSYTVIDSTGVAELSYDGRFSESLFKPVNDKRFYAFVSDKCIVDPLQDALDEIKKEIYGDPKTKKAVKKVAKKKTPKKAVVAVKMIKLARPIPRHLSPVPKSSRTKKTKMDELAELVKQIKKSMGK